MMRSAWTNPRLPAADFTLFVSSILPLDKFERLSQLGICGQWRLCHPSTAIHAHSRCGSLLIVSWISSSDRRWERRQQAASNHYHGIEERWPADVGGIFSPWILWITLRRRYSHGIPLGITRLNTERERKKESSSSEAIQWEATWIFSSIWWSIFFIMTTSSICSTSSRVGHKSRMDTFCEVELSESCSRSTWTLPANA